LRSTIEPAAFARRTLKKCKTRNRQFRTSSFTASCSQSEKPHGRRSLGEPSADARDAQRRENAEAGSSRAGRPGQRIADQ
jgi:hypothetical protein